MTYFIVFALTISGFALIVSVFALIVSAYDDDVVIVGYHKWECVFTLMISANDQSHLS